MRAYIIKSCSYRGILFKHLQNQRPKILANGRPKEMKVDRDEKGKFEQYPEISHNSSSALIIFNLRF